MIGDPAMKGGSNQRGQRIIGVRRKQSEAMLWGLAHSRLPVFSLPLEWAGGIRDCDGPSHGSDENYQSDRTPKQRKDSC